MRKTFAALLARAMGDNDKIVLLTADMGFGLWDGIRDIYPKRFFNVGAAEQLMIGCAAGMAMEGLTPVCYSITPFLLYRPFEFIRNFMEFERLPIKLVGGGRDRDYGNLGYTHWAEEDGPILHALPGITKFWPKDSASLNPQVSAFLTNNSPSYMNLRR